MKIIISQIIEEVKTFKEKCQVNQVTEAECPIHPYSLFSRHKTAMPGAVRAGASLCVTLILF